ncbi:hypothetical protein CBM2613_U40015 [Cupriavidus taiwanensis]|nr:hypothetical protein CBM2613_U40015 [Cupriavidus taiwanensis]
MTLDLAILWRLHRVQPGRLTTMKGATRADISTLLKPDITTLPLQTFFA